MSIPAASQDQLKSLENTLLNQTGDVPLHKRFRALFTLKALKNEQAVRIISKGACSTLYLICNAIDCVI
jgi:deoxyhypusine monooxygenase